MTWLTTLLQWAGIASRPPPADDKLTPEQRAEVEEWRWWYPDVAEMLERKWGGIL